MTLEEEIGVLLSYQDPVYLIRVILQLQRWSSPALRSGDVSKAIWLIKSRLNEALISPIRELRELAEELSKE